MLPHNQALKLVNIYCKVCTLYDNHLCFTAQRFSNNNEPNFTDQEVITIFLYSMIEEERHTNKQIHTFADRYLRSWFPLLPSYPAFINRINRLGETFKHLCDIIFTQYLPDDCDTSKSLLDSMPIITCSGKRTPKVATEITDKTYSATKGFWYHGLKLHALGFHRPSRLPFPESIVITPASENDLNVFKQNWSEITNREFFGDKIYFDNKFFDQLYKEKQSVMFTPVKITKGTDELTKQREKAYNDLFSSAVSTVRQPIESLFNWVNEKTKIQIASKVRSTKGLITHVFGRLAAACFGMVFNY